jgi:penicillin-binding protein 2
MVLYRGQQSNRNSAVRPRSRAPTGVGWVSARRRRRRWRIVPPLTVRHRPIVEPISSAEQEFVRRSAFYMRVGALGLVAATLFGVLLLRLWSLQVIQGARLAHAARAQTFRTVYLPTSRGSIVDRSRRMLVGTTGQLAVTADAASLGKIDAKSRWRPTRRGRAELRRLARLAHRPTWTLVAAVRRSVRRAPFAPAIVVAHASRDLAGYLDERAASFRGFQTTVLPQRWYPFGGLGSEFLGLLGEVDKQELHTRRYAHARAGQIVGQSGVEATYDRVLDRGLATGRVPVDARGTVVGGLRLQPVRRTGHGLQLTIDARLQRAAEHAIQDGIQFAHRAGHADANAGAAVVMNPWNGAVYALASYPSFDQTAAAHNPRYFASLFRAHNTPLLDRATQGLYPTGSTFKPIVAEAALASGLITPWSSIPCTGSLLVGNIVFHNVEPAINESMNLDQALTVSCDTWFYRLGTMFYARQASTGALDMQRWAHLLGLGHRTGIDVPGEYGGVVPTPGWLRRTFRDPLQRIWYEGYSVNLSIGQGYLAVTPLQLAVAYSALANGGSVVRPHVAQALLTPSGTTARVLHFRPRRRLHLVDVDTIRQGLYNAAHSADGTSSAVFGSFPVPVAGKTGTAQTPNGSDHSWYASWAPAYKPQVVVVVLIEHGGFGVEAAAPAAREIYSSFFHVHQPQTPPTG